MDELDELDALRAELRDSFKYFLGNIEEDGGEVTPGNVAGFVAQIATDIGGGQRFVSDVIEALLHAEHT